VTDDIRTTAGKNADLRRRRLEAINSASNEAIEKRHAKGKMTARERIEKLVDPGSFVEMDSFARHRSTNFGMEKIALTAMGLSLDTQRSMVDRSRFTRKTFLFLVGHLVK